MPRALKLRAYAKVNLGLEVLGLRDDGYHELRTTFQSLALHDTLTCTPGGRGFTIVSNDPACPADESNLVWKAAERLWRAAGKRGALPATTVQIVKRVPVQAGLGGGSSDAASALRALRELWRLPVSDEALEELGRGPLPGAYFSSGVLAAEILLAGAPEALKQRLLPAIGDGSAIVVPALADPSNRFGAESVTTRLEKAGAGFVLEGSKRYVQDGGAATHFLVAARRDDGRIALACIARNAPGVSVCHQQGFLIGASEVRFERAAVDPADVFGDWNTVEDALTRALPILGAFITGALQEISEFTNAYTSERIVYGQPIGRYQRVQDNCIEILNHLDATRWITWETLWKLDTGQDARAAARQCKAVASEGYFQGCNQSHMVFAGPGTDYRHPLMAHSVLAHALYPYLGSPLHNKRAMMDIRFPRKV